MTESRGIPNLWPEDIKVDVLTPLAIMRSQAKHLEDMTKGSLRGEIEIAKSDPLWKYEFLMIAPAIGSKHLLFTVFHREDVYPAEVHAETFRGENAPDDDKVIADDESEFLVIIAKVFRSKSVRSRIDSLIARSNELRAKSA